MKTSIECYNELVNAIHDHATLDVICRLYSCYILACWSGNVSQASRVLGIHRRTLHRWEREKSLAL